MSWGFGLMSQCEQVRAVQLSRKRQWNQLVAVPGCSSNRSGSDGSKVTPCQRHRREEVVTMNELQGCIDEVNAVDSGTTCFQNPCWFFWLGRITSRTPK